VITYRRTFQGAWELSALVSDPYTGFEYYEHAQFMGYTKAEAKSLFLDRLTSNNQTLVKE